MKWAWKQGDRIVCYEIDHAGEGDRGRSYTFPPAFVPDAGSQCAEVAAERFDDTAKREQDLTDSDFDGGSQVIEVVGVYDAPARFRVTCRVVRTYQSNMGEATP